MNEFGQYRHATFLPDHAGVVQRGCCIRFDEDGPYLHTNSTHQSVGIIPSSLKITSIGDLEFQLDITLPVITTSISEDETLTTRGIAGGLSGGGGLCIVRFRQEGMGHNSKLWLKDPAHYAEIAGSTSNIWVGITSFYDGKG